MKILALDASAKSCAAALYEEKLLGEMYLDLGLTHSEKLLPMIDALLEVTDTEKASLSALAVTAGPGSFTGLRIGMATAQGLCRALSIPIAPVPTLLALKEGGSGFPGVVCPMMDARRGEVYTALYRGEEALLPGGPRPLTELLSAAETLSSPVFFLGDGAAVHREAIASALGDRAVFAAAERNLLRASWVAVAAVKQGRFVPEAQASIDYMRVSQAERLRHGT